MQGWDAGKITFHWPQARRVPGCMPWPGHILVSPRIKGNNTPMRLYSYLHSGKAVLATNLPPHTQILDNRVAMLADPTPKHGKGIAWLVNDATLREELGSAGKALIEEHHFSVLRDKLNNLYDSLDPTSHNRRRLTVSI